VACCGVPGAPIEVTYLGVGGWVVRRGASAVLFAPLFSNPSLFRTGLGTIEPDTLRIDRALAELDVDLGDVSLILSGHGHYDHAMDVPHVMERHAPRARLLANGTSAHQLAPWGLGARITVVDDSAGDQRVAGRWITQGDVRVMPFRSVHAPHFEGYTFFQGRRERDLIERPRTAQEWLDGETVSYLVDFMEGGRVVFRMFYQDAVAAEPFGLVTDSLLDESAGGRSVDLAVLVPSTFSSVPWHPEATVDNVRPRHVLLGHWEDFFRPPSPEPERLFFEDFGHFLERLGRVLSAASRPPAGWHMPVAGTRFLIR
jgi:L-ascorbate metabolism protein UlaG (beta-lactamase superfamily)